MPINPPPTGTGGGGGGTVIEPDADGWVTLPGLLPQRFVVTPGADGENSFEHQILFDSKVVIIGSTKPNVQG